MMMKTVSAADCAHILRQRLGPLRSWHDFLGDCIRNCTSLAGYKLLPAAQQHDGRAWRPRYSLADIKTFIDAVLAAEPSAGPTGRIPHNVLDIRPGTFWRQNRFDRHGNPAAAH